MHSGSERRPYRYQHGRFQRGRFQPARYVHALLLVQGLAWLVLAGAGLTFWADRFPRSVNLVSGGGALLWTGIELLGLVFGTCLGAAEVGMACRMRGGRPRFLLIGAAAIQGLMVAIGLLLAALLVTLGGSMLELLALGRLGRHALRRASPDA